jgi:hypothetical protein
MNPQKRIWDLLALAIFAAAIAAAAGSPSLWRYLTVVGVSARNREYPPGSKPRGQR